MYDAESKRESDEEAIHRAREHSNRSIARRNILGVGDSLCADYLGVIGDGSFVPSRAEYLRLFKEGFDRPKQCLAYLRTPQSIIVAEDRGLAAESGTWEATASNGELRSSGAYSAMWNNTTEGWKIRTELFVTLKADRV